MGGCFVRSKPAPEAWLRIDVLQCSGLKLPSEPGLDRLVRSAASSILQSFTSVDYMHLVFPYVEVSFGRQVKCTQASSALEENDVDICQPLFFSLRKFNPEALGKEPFELNFIVKHKNKKPGLFRRDVVLGRTCLKTSSPTLEPLCLRLQDNGVDTGRTLLIKISVVNLTEAPKVLGQSHEFPLVKVLHVLTTVLRSPDGIDLLMKARPKRLRTSDDSARKEFEELVEQLNEEFAALESSRNCDRESDFSETDVIKRFSIFSRGLLVFVERFSKSKKDILGLCIKWLRNFFKEYVQVKSSMANAMLSFNEERVRRLLEAAQVQVHNLQPIDENGQVIAWTRKVDSVTDDWWWKCAKLVNLTADTAVIGDGAFGCVWRARDIHTKKLFAVKNVPVHAKGSFQDQVARREIDLLNRICMERHPCIVDLHFAGHSEISKLYVHVMELCSGGNLKDKLIAARANGKYELPKAAMDWIGEILLALEYLHLQAEVLHRDIKSENVVFSSKDVAKLTDFGVSRFGSTAGEWTFNFPPGSTLYIAPEVLRQDQYDCRADLYSFGILVWLVLSGGLSENCVPPEAADIRQNWKALSECIADPPGHSALALPTKDADNFVLQLTHPEASLRPMHETIREHPFIQPLALPAIGATAQAVDEWIESRNCEDVEFPQDTCIITRQVSPVVEEMPLKQME